MQPPRYNHKSKYLLLTPDLLIPLTLIILVISLYLYAFLTPAFSLQLTECWVDQEPCQNTTLTAELAKYHGHNLLTLDLPPIKNRLLSGDPTLLTAQLVKKLPHTLILQATQVAPVLALKPDSVTDIWITLDANFRVIGTVSAPPPVPTLTVRSLPTIQIGQSLTDPMLLTALQFILRARHELPQLAQVSLEEDNLVLTIQDGPAATLGLTGDLDSQLRTLQAILLDTTMIKDVSHIDVRFARPVLR